MPSEFHPIRILFEDQDRIVSESRRPMSARPVRVTVFSRPISEDEAFRRAFRMDREILANLTHAVIPILIEAGESEGQLFFSTTLPDGVPLSSLRGSLSLDDIVDIGWQLCSALQQAHNLGAAHGGIDADVVLLTPDRRVSLLDFGVQRWLRAGNGNSQTLGLQSEWRSEISEDLQALAGVLLELLPDHDADGLSVTRAEAALRKVLENAAGNSPSLRPDSAREFQGRLGELLLGDGDAIPTVVDRKSGSGSRRSIVEELFDVPHSADERSSKELLPELPQRSQFLLILLVILLGILLLVFAVSLL
ncbi:MAG: hypothetical protein KDA96_23325 [Planctomycetaceae bacterium]|nr:hypothetical protein [Planctomycetaceae bacterium]